MGYLDALLLTLALEMPVYAGVLRTGLRIPARNGLAAGALVNLVSHPLAFLVLMPAIAPRLGYLPTLVVLEAAVWILEAALLWLWLGRDADLIGLAGLLANALSLGLGLLLLR